MCEAKAVRDRWDYGKMHLKKKKNSFIFGWTGSSLLLEGFI